MDLPTNVYEEQELHEFHVEQYKAVQIVETLVKNEGEIDEQLLPESLKKQAD